MKSEGLVSPVLCPGVPLSGLPIFEEEREILGYKLQFSLRGYLGEGVREGVYLPLQSEEDLVKESPEGGWGLGCRLLFHLYSVSGYHKDRKNRGVLQFIPNFYGLSVPLLEIPVHYLPLRDIPLR